MTFQEQLGARTLWAECRGEPEEGQRAVAAVLINRLRDGRWGKTLASVCMWPHQFSGWGADDPNRVPSCELADDDAMLKRLFGFVSDAQLLPDPTMGATHYFNPKLASPPWAMGSYIQIGNHRFFRNIK